METIANGFGVEETLGTVHQSKRVHARKNINGDLAMVDCRSRR